MVAVNPDEIRSVRRRGSGCEGNRSRLSASNDSAFPLSGLVIREGFFEELIPSLDSIRLH